MIDLLSLLAPYIEGKRFRDFNKKIVSDTKYAMLGVKVPNLKSIAKELAKDKTVPYELLKQQKTYYEEFFVCGLTISYAKIPYTEKMRLLEEFLDCVDNWGICDSLACASKFIGKNAKDSFDIIKKWISSQKTYTARFGIVCLLLYYVNDEYINEVLCIIKKIRSEEYYINMAIAWLISVALIKEYDKTLPLLINKETDIFIHNKAIQKAKESFRLSPEKKEFLNNLRIK